MKNQLNQLQGKAAAYWQQLLANPYIQQGVHWYGSQSSRDQNIIKAVTLLLVLALIFLMVYAPLLKSRTSAEVELNKNIKTYNLLASNAGRFTTGAASNNNVSILSAVTNQARAQNLNLSRYEQDGANLRIWLDRVPFDDAISCLEALERQYAVSVSQISIDRTDSVGRVDVRATLSRN